MQCNVIYDITNLPFNVAMNGVVLNAIKRETDVISGNNDYDGVPISVDDWWRHIWIFVGFERVRSGRFIRGVFSALVCDEIKVNVRTLNSYSQEYGFPVLYKKCWFRSFVTNLYLIGNKRFTCSQDRMHKMFKNHCYLKLKSLFLTICMMFVFISK